MAGHAHFAFDNLLTEIASYPHHLPPLVLHGFLTGWVLTPELGGLKGSYFQQFLGIDEVIDWKQLPKSLWHAFSNCLSTFRDTLNEQEFIPLKNETLSNLGAEQWCQGFILAVELAADRWAKLTRDDLVLEQHLATVRALASSDFYTEVLQRPQHTRSKFVIEGANALTALVNLLAGHALGLEIEPADEESADFDVQGLKNFSEKELMKFLSEMGVRLPESVIKECIAREHTMLPEIRYYLGDETHWSEQATEEEFLGVFYSLIILGQSESQEAADLILDSFTRQFHQPDHILWKWLNNYWPALFSNKLKCNGIDTEVFAAFTLEVDYPTPARQVAMDCWIALNWLTENIESALDELATFADDPTQSISLRIHAGKLLLAFPREPHRSLLLELARFQMEDPEVEYVVFDDDDVETAFAEGDTPPWDTDET